MEVNRRENFKQLTSNIMVMLNRCNRQVTIGTGRKQYPTVQYVSYSDTQLALLYPPPTKILNSRCMLLWSQDKMTAALALGGCEKWRDSSIATSIMLQNINARPQQVFLKRHPPSPKCNLCWLDVSLSHPLLPHPQYIFRKPRPAKNLFSSQRP